MWNWAWQQAITHLYHIQNNDICGDFYFSSFHSMMLYSVHVIVYTISIIMTSIYVMLIVCNVRDRMGTDWHGLDRYTYSMRKSCVTNKIVASSHRIDWFPKLVFTLTPQITFEYFFFISDQCPQLNFDPFVSFCWWKHQSTHQIHTQHVRLLQHTPIYSHT